MTRQANTLFALTLSAATPVCAVHDHHEPHDHARHATPAPAGVMGDHLHPQGEWMVSWRYMHMDMEGSLKGSDHISNREIISPGGENFLVTPTQMSMDMHMLGVMYAPTGNVTLLS